MNVYEMEFREGVLDALKTNKRIILSDWITPTKPMGVPSRQGTKATIKKPSLRFMANQESRTQDEHASHVQALADTIPLNASEDVISQDDVDVSAFYAVLSVMRLSASGHQKKLLSRKV